MPRVGGRMKRNARRHRVCVRGGVAHREADREENDQDVQAPQVALLEKIERRAKAVVAWL